MIVKMEPMWQLFTHKEIVEQLFISNNYDIHHQHPHTSIDSTCYDLL